jgi:hypothetical protein
MAYYDNYLIDTTSRVVLGVEATVARFSQETAAPQKMVEQVQKLGLKPESLGADKAYDSGEFLARRLDRGVQLHVPVIDRRHQTKGRFTRDQFRYDLQRMLTTVLKEMCSRLAAAGATVKATSIAPRKRSARVAGKSNIARLGLIADCLCTSKNPSGKRSAPGPERQLMSVRGRLAAKSKLCLLNSSSECACIECDYRPCPPAPFP